MINVKDLVRIKAKEVWMSWLESEWSTPRFADARKKRAKPFKSDEKVLEILKIDGKRHFIIDQLPDDIVWFKGKIDSHNLKGAFIIPASEWTKIFPKSLRVSNVFKNLYGDIQLKDSMLSNIKDSHLADCKPILVSTNINSRHTILEGNHRVLSLMFAPNKEISVYIGYSPKMDKYRWHIENYIKNKN